MRQPDKINQSHKDCLDVRVLQTRQTPPVPLRTLDIQTKIRKSIQTKSSHNLLKMNYQEFKGLKTDISEYLRKLSITKETNSIREIHDIIIDKFEKIEPVFRIDYEFQISKNTVTLETKQKFNKKETVDKVALGIINKQSTIQLKNTSAAIINRRDLELLIIFTFSNNIQHIRTHLIEHSVHLLNLLYRLEKSLHLGERSLHLGPS